MQPAEYRKALDRLEYTQEGFAELIGATPRTGQNWATVSVPPAVQTLVKLLLARPELIAVLEGWRQEPVGKRKRRSTATK